MTRRRELPPSSPFAGDDGSADPGLTAALEALAAGRGALSDVVAALALTRVLIPVLAEPEVADVVVHAGTAHTVDKEASAGIVALRAPDGRTALPAFSSVASMAAWRAEARPVPTDVARAALSAVAQGWEVLVLDPGGPVTVLVPRPAVWALAQQVPWEPAVAAGVVDDAVGAAVRAAVTGVPHVVRGDVEPGRRAEIAVVLALEPGLDRAGLDDVLARVNAALAADPTVAARVDSLELRLTTVG
ncbi:SseB family protein [Pengzhenrongella frigida]|uniref:SseB family protein n=1 Tax=Pengzhenrongella frigida TaxID=1259133 RepID=A0A4Q5N2V2_9MICO|nr:SseB family protein [Cellulomonas sp. HLT2-17]RYV52509.1 SseB family protein [Cellulomonas sp. HLT2-17]